MKWNTKQRINYIPSKEGIIPNFHVFAVTMIPVFVQTLIGAYIAYSVGDITQNIQGTC